MHNTHTHTHQQIRTLTHKHAHNLDFLFFHSHITLVAKLKFNLHAVRNVKNRARPRVPSIHIGVQPLGSFLFLIFLTKCTVELKIIHSPGPLFHWSSWSNFVNLTYSPFRQWTALLRFYELCLYRFVKLSPERVTFLLDMMRDIASYVESKVSFIVLLENTRNMVQAFHFAGPL